MKEKARKLWEELLSKNPTNDDLWYVIVSVASLRKEAGKQLLRQKPTNRDLLYVIVNVDSLREEAQKILREREEATPPSPTSPPPVHKRTIDDIIREMRAL